VQDEGLRGSDLRRGLRAAGAILFNLLLLLIPAALLLLVLRRTYDDTRAVVFLGVLVLAVAAVASPIARFELAPELIPVPFAALMVAVLWGGRLALVLALTLALLLGGQQPLVGITVPFEAAVGGAAAAFGLRLAQRRLQAWALIGVIAAAYAAAAIAIGLIRARGAPEIAEAIAWGTVNSVFSTLFAIGFLPLAEWFTRVTTTQTLMELADPKHPLLQRLSLEAPGTYAHTISVANLAEAVCNAIGANALLARVGVYYHDIGKITKPLYFIENQPRGRNPHDRLKPSMSAAVVRSHVIEGLRLAGEYRLPGVVRDFIAQHHGTQPISFFMEQAQQEESAPRVDPADFAYGGPRPQTRETAIVMLADSVESASRVLQDPSPDRRREDRVRAAGRVPAHAAGDHHREGDADEGPRRDVPPAAGLPEQPRRQCRRGRHACRRGAVGRRGAGRRRWMSSSCTCRRRPASKRRSIARRWRPSRSTSCGLRVSRQESCPWSSRGTSRSRS
jgi:cyclic-di-AMP phosphodiesterase PgpH